MAFGQGVVVMGGYWSCPAVQCGATVTTALTAPTSLFVALIRTYTPMHSDDFAYASFLSSPCFTLQR